MEPNFISPLQGHLPNMPCPRCGKHNVVTQGEGRYDCLNCGWRRDTSGMTLPPLLMPLTVAVIVIFLALNSINSQDRDRRLQNVNGDSTLQEQVGAAEF